MLLDTNILLRISDQADPKHAITKEAVERLKQANRPLRIVPQILYEYWVVATRPLAENGLGMSPDDADASIVDWIALLTLLRDERMVFEHWREVVRKYRVIGRLAHDARIVAAMNRHGITELLTHDPKDFARFDGIVVLTPEMVIGSG